MTYYPSIYEINTRVWIKRFAKNNTIPKLDEIQAEYWKSLAGKGIDYVWLMGVWNTPKGTEKKYCFEESLIKDYKYALKDWKTDDVSGSPFAIDDYTLNPEFGTTESLLKLRKQLHSFGIKLILDFIPNHFHAESKIVATNPEVFLEVDEKHYSNDQFTFFKSSGGKYFAHGRDPFFPAWQDTIQVDYFSEDARNFMIDKLLTVEKLCDGVRCDMAMLALTNVFQNTWGNLIYSPGNSRPTSEFWGDAIKIVKSRNSNFLFLAEAYWDMEFQLQKLGFDFTYDKNLTDRLIRGNAAVVRDHLCAEIKYQKKSARFIENHDEPRAIATLGKHKSMAAAIIISTIPGMRFYFDGQFEGKKVRLPVQLNREPQENEDGELKLFYEKLLEITSNEIFKRGEWKLLSPYSSWENNFSFQNILGFQWKLGNQMRLVFINYSDQVSSCLVNFDIEGFAEEIELTDLLNQKKYLRSAEDIIRNGLYIELKNYHSHIFKL